MNPPRPPPASAALTTTSPPKDEATAPPPPAAAAGASASASSVPFASTAWDPSTRGWLVPTASQVAAVAHEDRSKAHALAVNRAANAVVLHQEPGPKRIRVVERETRVLDEDEHLANVESIIRRDFFPAIAAMDQRLVQPTPMMRMRGDQLATPTPSSVSADTPMFAAKGDFEPDTPMTERPNSPSDQPGAAAAAAAAHQSTAVQLYAPSSAAAGSGSSLAGVAAASQQKYHPHELRLGTYLELHTSEDNAAYGEMKKKRRALLNDKHFYANDAYEQRVNDQRLVLVDSDKDRSGNLDTWKWRAKNRLFFYPDHEGQSELAEDEKDSPDVKMERARKAESKTIVYENTRFPGKLFNPFPGVNATNRGDTTPAAAATTPGTSTPAVGGYKLVQTPTPSASVLGGASPLMTWGQILATPAHLSSEDLADESTAALALSLPTDGFRVQQASARDEKAWKLADKGRKRERAEKKRKREDMTPVPLGAATPVGGRTPLSNGLAALRPPASPMHPQVMMSPAAQRLMEKALKAKGMGKPGTPMHATAAMAVDTQLRASYATPSPAALAHGRSGAARTAAAAGGLASQRRPRVPQFQETPQRLDLPTSTPQPAR